MISSPVEYEQCLPSLHGGLPSKRVYLVSSKIGHHEPQWRPCPQIYPCIFLSILPEVPTENKCLERPDHSFVNNSFAYIITLIDFQN